MILIFSSQLSWKATALLLLAQLAFVLLQPSSGPFLALRTWFYAQTPQQQPNLSTPSQLATDDLATADLASGMFHTILPLAVVAAVVGVFCYAARSEARRHGHGGPRRHPWAGFPEMQQQQEHQRTSSDLAAAINRLPIETYLDREQLAALSARELKEKLEQRHMPVGRVLEKDEAIAELLAAGGSTADMCIVCFGEYRRGDTLRRLKCDHAFHVECIDRWLLSQRTGARCCPVCKDPLQM